MSNRWELVLIKEMGEVVIESYKNKNEAEEEIGYRNNLCRHMGYEPDLLYAIREVKKKQ